MHALRDLVVGHTLACQAKLTNPAYIAVRNSCETWYSPNVNQGFANPGSTLLTAFHFHFYSRQLLAVYMSQSSRLEPVEPAAMNGRISKYAGHLSQVDRICRGATSAVLRKVWLALPGHDGSAFLVCVKIGWPKSSQVPWITVDYSIIFGYPST